MPCYVSFLFHQRKSKTTMSQNQCHSLRHMQQRLEASFITIDRCKLCNKMATRNEKSMFPFVKGKFVFRFVYTVIYFIVSEFGVARTFHVNERNMKGMKHECGTVYCKICGKYDHYCFMQPIVEPKHTLQKWCFFDFETRQDQEHSKNAFGHRTTTFVPKLLTSYAYLQPAGHTVMTTI